jgi:rhamnosyltransferase
MYRQTWPPLHWKLTDGYRLLLKYGFYALFTKSRLEHLHMMSLGIWHGLRGRSGRLDAARG